jgi:hypothetical protein
MDQFLDLYFEFFVDIFAATDNRDLEPWWKYRRGFGIAVAI